MVYTFTLATQAFSVNAYRYKRNFAKTAEARAYESKILDMLEEHKSLHDMAARFNELGGTFEVSITCVYPNHIFYNQAGAVSAKTFDCSNVEKPLIDLILNGFMNVDDRFVTKLTSSKRAGHNYAIIISLEHVANLHDK